MKERPILFSAPMVRALLDGRKTQTRRVVKPRTGAHDISMIISTPDSAAAFIRNSCPYGQPGDWLWVRQEHYRFGHWEPVPDVKTKGDRQKWKFVADTEETLYEAPDKYRKGRHHKDSATPAWNKRLARFMPRRLSVIDLEITAVRVERLQDISYEGALAEGMPDHRPLIESECTHGETADECARRLKWPQREYMNLWNAINGPGSWAASPFVWVVEFKKLEGPTP